MTCTIYLEHQTPDGKKSERKDTYVLIKKILDVSEIRYVWFNFESESFDDSKTFRNEDEAKRDILNAFSTTKEIFGDKVISIILECTKSIKDIK